MVKDSRIGAASCYDPSGGLIVAVALERIGFEAFSPKIGISQKTSNNYHPPEKISSTKKVKVLSAKEF